MSKILEMIEKRNQAWNAAKAFVESRRDADGLLSGEDAKTYADGKDAAIAAAKKAGDDA